MAAWMLLLLVSSVTLADGPDHQHGSGLLGSLHDRDTLTNGWFGLGEKLQEKGITLSLSLTQIYQLNLAGGMSTHRRSGRWAGSYDLELELDLEKIINLPGGSIYISAEGSWSDGLDASSVGSVFGVNADAAGGRSIDVTQFYYEQSLLGDKLRVRVGKLDLSGGFECRGCPVAFDGNAYANDQTGQFLNGALVNNPTIPFPGLGMGAVIYVEPMEWLYAAVGTADAQADGRETGFMTAFHDADYFFSIFEMGVVPELPSAQGPLVGTYRVGFWHDPQPKDPHNGSNAKRDDVGFYLSFDQAVWKENADADDGQGVGLFARYGFAHSDVNEVKCFWSVGGQYQGVIPTRDDDVLALGVAQGKLVEAAGYTKHHETVMELYYNAAVTPWLNIGPSVQYIWNPGGDTSVSDAVVVGVRAQMSF